MTEINKENKTTIKTGIELITAAENSIAESLAEVVGVLQEEGVSFSSAIASVCDLYDDWPRHDKDTTRSKEGDIISLTTIKRNKSDHIDFIESETFRLVNNFERNFRRYYQHGSEGTIELIPPKPEEPEEPKGAEEDNTEFTLTEELADINTALGVQMQRLFNMKEKLPEADEIMLSLSVTTKAIADKISDLNNAGEAPAAELDKAA